MTSAAVYRLSPLELSSGLVLSTDGTLPALPPPAPGASARSLLEDAVLPALLRPPCLVSFSGGRDSSAVLALATHVARREGLPLPIPATNRFPAAEGADESEWQERVIAHLGLSDWLRHDLTDELDCVGPVATASLRRHGVLWPCNAHFHVPLFEAAAGGAVLTGIGGDEAFLPGSRSAYLDVLRGRRRPVARDVLRVGFALSPVLVRRVLIERRFPEVCWWLRPQALSDVRAALALEAAREPLRWATRFRWVHGFHYLRVGLRSLDVLAADHDVLAVHPFAEPRFLGALAELPRGERFSERSEAMTSLFGDLLPAELHSRSTKARFDGAFWAEHSRGFVARWNGGGIDHELVDVDILREVWRSPRPDARSFTVLQAVWLALEGEPARESAGEPLEQELDRVV